MMSDAEQLFVCSLAIHAPSLEKCLFTSLAHIWMQVFVVEFYEFAIYSRYSFIFSFVNISFCLHSLNEHFSKCGLQIM